MERETGFEPATFSLARRCSTPEPLPHAAVLAAPGQPLYYTVYPWVCQAAKGGAGRASAVLPRRPAERPTAEQVQMQVEDTLARVRAGVPYQPVPGLGDALALGDLVGYAHQGRE